MGLIIHFDGGSRGNPGPAGAGVVIQTEDHQRVFEGAYFLGHQTNNAAEYHGLIRSLQRALCEDAGDVQLFSDSELLVRQITGEYRVKSPRLQQLFQQAQLLLLKIPRWRIQHVRRDENKRADELANLAMDRGADVIVFDTGGAESPPEPSPTADTDTPAPVADSTPSPALVHPGQEDESQRSVKVRLTTAPAPGACPAEGCDVREFTVEHTLPAGLCVHAAHAILPTLLAMQNTDTAEFAAIPTMMVRCARPGCGASFQLAPARSNNGAPGG